MLKDKRGATTWLWVLVGIAVLITVMSFFLGDITDAISNVSVSGATKISEFYTGNNFIFSYVTKGADYIIGAVPENILDSSNKFSGLIMGFIRGVVLLIVVLSVFSELPSGFLYEIVTTKSVVGQFLDENIGFLSAPDVK